MKHDYDIDALLAKHFTGERLTAGEQSQLNAWMADNDGEYRKIKRLMEAEIPQAQAFDADAAWEKVEGRLTRRLTIHWNRRMVAGWAAAAVFLIVFGIASFLFLQNDVEETSAHFANTSGHEQIVVLPDSSEVTLYPSSRIDYLADAGGRKVNLEGKAFFQVRKNGQTFSVDAGTLNVEVLGTSFLVDVQQADSSGVYVKTGRVQVEAAGSQTILTADRRAVLSGDVLRVDSIANPRMTFGGRSRMLSFERAPLWEVVGTVKDATDVEILLDKGLGGQLVTTRISTDDYESIAAELAFICGCRCDTLKAGKRYRLYYE